MAKNKTDLTARSIPGDCGRLQPGRVEADGAGAGEGMILGAAAAATVEVDARQRRRRRWLGAVEELVA